MGDHPSNDSSDDKYQDLASQWVSRAYDVSVPALLIRRASGLHEPLLGRRARYLMTSHNDDGQITAYGWKDGLRVISEVIHHVQGIEEPAVWIQEERDYYGDCLTTNRFAVGLSRLWVEQYVSRRDAPPVMDPQPWLDNLNRNPNAPELRSLQMAEGHPDPVGRRVVIVADTIETDLRAVSPLRMTDSGDLALTVLAERDWYRWSERDCAKQAHASLRWEPAARVWVE